MGGQIVGATVIQARRPRRRQHEKATFEGGAVPAGWSKAKLAQMDTEGRSTLRRGRKHSLASSRSGESSGPSSSSRSSATRTSSASTATSASSASRQASQDLQDRCSAAAPVPPDPHHGRAANDLHPAPRPHPSRCCRQRVSSTHSLDAAQLFDRQAAARQRRQHGSNSAEAVARQERTIRRQIRDSMPSLRAARRCSIILRPGSPRITEASIRRAEPLVVADLF